MEAQNKEKLEKDIISIPIYFKSYKDSYVGKGSLKPDKTSFKFAPPKTSDQPISSRYNLKEFKLINKDKSKKNIYYKGREISQDSFYILMKYNSDNRSINICPANKWINFTQTFNYKEENIEEKEKNKKEKKKEEYKSLKQFFNFDYIGEMNPELKPKKPKRKKKTLLPNEKEDDDDDEKEKDYDDDDSGPKKKKRKKNIYDFEEDSHSSELSLGLDEDSYESEKERRKEEKKKFEEEEKRKKEEEKKKEKDKNLSYDEDDDDDDKSFDDLPSEVEEENEENDKFLKQLGNKRKRDKNPYDNMTEELNNLLMKKNQRTYEEIVLELNKKFKKELVQENIDNLLDENTNKFIEGGETYYFKK